MSSNGSLIVAHAQNPLREGIYPNKEFAARLDLAATLFDDARASELAAKSVIYVPGSRHRRGRRVDHVPLAAAGVRYLTQRRGVPFGRTHGSDWNRRYKGERGVYNAGDEVYVAAQALREHAQTYSRLVAVCSLSQVPRLLLHYQAYGLEPEIHTIQPEPGSVDSHGGLIERVLTMYTRRLNPTWQRGLIPRLIRATRLP